MKMKSINVMLTICLAATISACGSNGSAPQEVTPVEETEETTAETVGESEEPPVYEEVSYEVVIMEANEETGIWKACDANGQEYDVTAADNLPDEELALLVPGGGVKISTELLSDEESSENATDAAPINIEAKKVEGLDESKSYELSQAVEQLVLGYTMEDIAETPMYANADVNVRKGPTTDEEKIGTLSTSEEVSVTGLTSTNWYRIKYNETTGYVSADYLQNEKPVIQSAESVGDPSGDGENSTAAPQPTEADNFLVYSEAEIMEAYNAGDYQRMSEMNQANVDAFDAKWGTNWGSSSAQQTGGSEVANESNNDSSSAPAQKSTSTSKELADYINQKREEEGKSAMAWSDALAELAMKRAEEIVDNFSHQTSLAVGAEIIQKNSGSSVASWFDSFYNSSGHRANMMSEYYTSIGAAVCQSGNYYYIVVLFEV